MPAPTRFAKAIAKATESAPEVVLPPAMVPGRVLHIDGDYLAYACGGTGSIPFAMCWRNLLDRAEGFRIYAGAQRVMLHFTDGTDKGGRGWIAETQPYQDNRKGKSAKPPHWAALRAACRKLPKPITRANLTALWVSDREADDSLSFVAARQRADEAGNLLDVICSRDKDLRMNPGLHLHWETSSLVRVNGYEVVGPEGLIYGTKWFYLQMLMGDKVDYIPGLGFKTGEKTALKLLEDCTTDSAAFVTVRDQYRARYGEQAGLRRFMEQAMLLWMRRDAAADPLDCFRRHPHISMLDAAERFLQERRDAHEAKCREAEAAA